jgi:hypothetical protein
MAAARRETTRWTVPGWHGTRTGIAIATTLRAVPGVRCLWVRIPPVLLEVKRVQRPVVQWQRHLSYKEGTGVRLPPGRFDEIGLLVQRKDAWPATRRSGFDSPVVHSTECPDSEGEYHASVLTRSSGFESWSGHWCATISGPDGEMDDHASLLTRCSGFESWSGQCLMVFVV